MAEKSGQSVGLLRWCGIALMSAGVLMVVATLLHPSSEPATVIIASEARLIAAHFLYTLSWLLVLLGLPGLYVSQRERMGRLGLAGFLVALSGTYLMGVGGNFGFFAPVMAKEAPATLDAIARYWPVAVINGLAAIAFMIGYVLFGIAMTRTALPRRSGVLVAVGAPAHLLGFGISGLVSTTAWPVAILGIVSLGLGLGWSGYWMWRTPAASDSLVFDKDTRV
jgi:drug/metabolite transporter (DMT)-like permease